MASDAYALRWCLFHMKRSCSEGEAVAVACSLSYVRKRSAGDIVSFVADLRTLKGQDTLLLSDPWCCRGMRSRGAVLVEQLWQRLVPRADAESAPAAVAWPRICERVASKLPLSTVRPMGLTAAGGAERCRIEVRLTAWRRSWIRRRASRGLLARLQKRVNIYDPVAGGAAGRD